MPAVVFGIKDDIYGGGTGKMRGCFTAIAVSLSNGRGVQLSFDGGSELWPAEKQYQYLATELRFSEREKYHLIQCFGEKVYTYAFGHDASNSVASVTFISFLVGENGVDRADIISRFAAQYSMRRVSVDRKTAQIILGSNVLKGFVVGLDSGTVDPHHNLQSFTVHLVLVDDQGSAVSMPLPPAGGTVGGGSGAPPSSGGKPPPAGGKPKPPKPTFGTPPDLGPKISLGTPGPISTPGGPSLGGPKGSVAV